MSLKNRSKKTHVFVMPMIRKKDLELKHIILDATCGGRSIWFTKDHPNAYYIDKRRKEEGFIENHPKVKIDPDEIMDFRSLRFPDKRFKLVIFDPPHLTNISSKNWLYQKYGTLNKINWKDYIRKGFNECYRVLEDYGILIFKWSITARTEKTKEIRIPDVIKILPVKPLFGHTSGSKSNTIWMCFMKIPKESQ